MRRSRIRVSLVSGPGDAGLAEILAGRLRAHGVEWKTHQAADGFDAAAEALLDELDRSSHVVLIVSASSRDSAWFRFLSGYCLGRRRGVFLFAQPPAGIEGLLRGRLRAFDDLAEVDSAIKSEIKAWIEKERVDEARRTLIEAGFGLSSETMARLVEQGDLENVGNFLAIGFPPDTENAAGVPLLCLAVRFRHAGLVRLLFENGVDLNRPARDRGNTALMDAAVQGDADVAAALINSGADLDRRNKSAQTALMLAIGEGGLEVAVKLLEAGADAALVDALGMTARKYAALFGRREVLALLDAAEGGSDGQA